MGLSELTVLTAETWGCYDRNASDVVAKSHKDLMEAVDSREINQRHLLFSKLLILVMVSIWVVAAHRLLLLAATSLGWMSCLVIPHPREFTTQIDRANAGLFRGAFNQNLFALSQPMAPSCALADAF